MSAQSKVYLFQSKYIYIEIRIVILKGLSGVRKSRFFGNFVFENWIDVLTRESFYV